MRFHSIFIFLITLFIGFSSHLYGEHWQERLSEGTKLFQAGDPQGAIEKGEKALSLAIQQFGEDHLGTATCKNHLATFYYMGRNDYEKAQKLYTDALNVRVKHLGELNGQVATTLNNLGYLAYLLEQYEDSESFLIRALAIKEKILGRNHESVINTVKNLAGLYEAMGDAKKHEMMALRIQIFQAKKEKK